MTLLNTEPVTNSTDDDNIIHLYCPICEPDGNISYCGKDISNDVEIPPEEGDGTPDDCALCWVSSGGHFC